MIKWPQLPILCFGEGIMKHTRTSDEDTLLSFTHTRTLTDMTLSLSLSLSLSHTHTQSYTTHTRTHRRTHTYAHTHTHTHTHTQHSALEADLACVLLLDEDGAAHAHHTHARTHTRTHTHVPSTAPSRLIWPASRCWMKTGQSLCASSSFLSCATSPRSLFTSI